MKTSTILAAVLTAIALSAASCTTPKLETKTLEPRVERLVSTPGETVRGETLLQRGAVVAFYQARHHKPAWDLPKDAESIREAIVAIAKDGLDPRDYHLAAIDTLLGERGQMRTDDSDADLEILLTDAVAAMIDHVRYGRVQPAALDPRWNVDSREGAPPLGEALARVAAAPAPAVAIEGEKLDHFIYAGLKSELGRLSEIGQRTHGWTPIPGKPPGKLVAGAHDARIPFVRARLVATGELAEFGDSTAWDSTLVEAVKRFQDLHRLDPDGDLDARTVAELNVPIERRIGQVRVNLERARWVLPGRTALGGTFLLVNLPAFKAYLIRDRQRVWETRTQIGKEARKTPIFRADMKHVIWNPTWTVPPTILKEDVVGGIRRGENMLAKKNLKVYDRKGNQVDPSSINWSAASAGNFPYTLRQDAGADNALGRVKFMFPNKYDIYLHDTPSRDLFSAEKRTFSSGCIRIEDPIGLAKQLLGDQGYDDAKIASVIESGKTQQVNLKTPLPVLIVYWTTSVGVSGDVRWAPDVYDRDPAVFAALAAPPVPGPDAPADSAVAASADAASQGAQ